MIFLGKWYIFYLFRSFADRLIMERFANNLEACDAELRPVLKKVYELFLMTVLEKNLSWYVISGLLAPSDINKVREVAARLCAELGPESLALCDSFAITDTMLSAPIALDWVSYNTYDNQGELMTEQEWDDNVRKA